MIKFNQPRYILPLIVLPFIYVFFYMFHYTMASKEAPEIYRQTASINPDLPDPFLDKDNIKGKFDAYLDAYKNNRNYSAIQEIDRREEKPDTQLIDTVSIAPKPVSIEKVFSTPVNQPLLRRTGITQRRYAKRSVPTQQKASDYEKQMRLFKAQMNYMDSLMRGEVEMGIGGEERKRRQKEDSSKVKAESSKDLNHENVIDHWSIANEIKSPLLVEKSRAIFSTHFNTIIKDKKDFFIKAIIDEELKVSKDSRIRIRLLEDVVIGDIQIQKGQYLYGMVASFKPQRVEVHISSMLLKDQIIEVALDIYDVDGMKGLYVPESQFRELAKSMGSNMASGQQLHIDNPPDNQMQLMYGLAKDAFNTTTRAASKTIRKNKAKLKYNTMVYLVNTKKQNTSSNNQLTL